jgi:hypothetical protein
VLYVNPHHLQIVCAWSSITSHIKKCAREIMQSPIYGYGLPDPEQKDHEFTDEQKAAYAASAEALLEGDTFAHLHNSNVCFCPFLFLFCDNQSTIQGTIVKYGAPAIRHLVNKIYLQRRYSNTPSMAEKHLGINEPVPNPTMALSTSMVGSAHSHIAITNSFC